MSAKKQANIEKGGFPKSVGKPPFEHILNNCQLSINNRALVVELEYLLVVPAPVGRDNIRAILAETHSVTVAVGREREHIR